MATSVYLITVFGIGLLAYYVAQLLKTRARRLSFQQANNCVLPTPMRQNKWLNGFDLLRTLIGWYSQHIFLAESTRLIQRNNKTFSTRVAGGTIVWTSEPDNVKAILGTKFPDFELSSNRIKAFAPVVGDGIFAANGETWAHGRALLRPSFSRAQLAELDTYERHFEELVKRIPADGSTVVDLQPLFNLLTMDSASEVLFGESTHCLRPDPTQRSKELADAFDYSSLGVLDRYNLGPLIWFHFDRKFNRACKTLHQFADYFVDKAIALRHSPAKSEELIPGHGYVFIEELAKDTNDRKVLRDQLLSVLGAGRDTTAALLSLTTWVLARHPRAMQKLRAEIAELGGARLSYEQIRNMKYLRWVLSETLRLYPVIFVNNRVATRDTVLPVGGGPDRTTPIFIAKGQIITLHIWAMHRDPDLWGPDAEEFRPDRWEDLKAPWKYVPFGGGPRICPGQQFALMEASYVIIRLLQTYGRIESADTQPFVANLRVTLSLLNGAKVILGEK